MPDILIRMEMPRNVRTVSIFSDGTMLDYLTGMYVGKAVALPPHGDLIDLDEAYAKWIKGEEDVLTNVPVIVPAGKEESE